MNYSEIIKSMIDSKLLDLHTAFIGKVISVKSTTATVQPLGMIKQYGETAKRQAVLSNVPIAAYKIRTKKITYVSNATTNETQTEEVLKLEPISAGDIVICVCCDRDITDAKRGVNSIPALGHHALSNSVIVGVL